jgi:hypothetical protein
MADPSFKTLLERRIGEPDPYQTPLRPYDAKAEDILASTQKHSPPCFADATVGEAPYLHHLPQLNATF